jgi:hypothetical protein
MSERFAKETNDGLAARIEMRRLLVLQQCNILDSDCHDVEYDRITKLTQRLFNVSHTMLSFIDNDREFLKSTSGIDVDDESRSIEKALSVNTKSLASVAENGERVFVLTDEEHLSKLSTMFEYLEVNHKVPIAWHAMASIRIGQYAVGFLSMFDIDASRVFDTVERENFVDLADIISSLVTQRRETVIRSQRDRANLMLGFNHHLRTPVGSVFFLLSDDHSLMFYFLNW